MLMSSSKERIGAQIQSECEMASERNIEILTCIQFH